MSFSGSGGAAELAGVLAVAVGVGVAAIDVTVDVTVAAVAAVGSGKAVGASRASAPQAAAIRSEGARKRVTSFW